jgi:hypothetical protein
MGESTAMMMEQHLKMEEYQEKTNRLINGIQIKTTNIHEKQQQPTRSHFTKLSTIDPTVTITRDNSVTSKEDKQALNSRYTENDEVDFKIDAVLNQRQSEFNNLQEALEKLSNETESLVSNPLEEIFTLQTVINFQNYLKALSEQNRSKVLNQLGINQKLKIDELDVMKKLEGALTMLKSYNREVKSTQ